MGEPKYMTQRSKDGKRVRELVSVDGGPWHESPESVENNKLAFLPPDTKEEARPGVPLDQPAAPANPAETATAASTLGGGEPSGIDADIAAAEAELATDVNDRVPYDAIDSAKFGAEEGMSFGWGADAMGVGAQAAGHGEDSAIPSFVGNALLGPLGGLGGMVYGALSDDKGQPRTAGRGMDAPLDARSTRQAVADEYRDERDLAYQDNPYPAIGGELGGSLAASIPAMALAGGAAVASKAPALERAVVGLAKGAAEGLGIGAVQGAGKARSGQAGEGAKEGGEWGALLGGGLGALGGLVSPYAAKLAQKLGLSSLESTAESTGLGPADLAKLKAKGTTTLDAPAAVPGGGELPAGTKVKRSGREALQDLGRGMREEGLDGGSYEAQARKADLAKIAAGQEMEKATAELEAMYPGGYKPKTLNETEGFAQPDGTKERLMDALEFGGEAPMSKEPVTTPAPNERQLPPRAESQAAADDWDFIGERHTSGPELGKRKEPLVPAARNPEASPPPLPLKERTAEPPPEVDLMGDGAQQGKPSERRTEWQPRRADMPRDEKMGGGSVLQVFGIEDAVLAEAPSPKVRVSLRNLSGMLNNESKRLAKLNIKEATSASQKLADDFAAVSARPHTDFRTALEMRQFLDDLAYDATGQKAGQAAEHYTKMATEMRKAIDAALVGAPPELAGRMRKAMKTYERASESGRLASKSDDATRVTGPSRDEGRTPQGRVYAAGSRVIGNKPARSAAGVKNLGSYTLDKFPGALPATGVAADDEELRKAQQSLPR